MSRYIDADALLKSAVSKFKCVPSVGVIYYGNGEEIFDGEDLQDFIKAQPTADVEEVRHGYWTGMNGDQCSNCGKSLRDLMDGDSYYSSEFEYGGFDALVACPFCGAKMDGRRKENEG